MQRAREWYIQYPCHTLTEQKLTDFLSLHVWLIAGSSNSHAEGRRGLSHNHEFDWRYTFAAAEADLFHYHRDKLALKLAFVILKFILKVKSKPKGLAESLPCFAVSVLISALIDAAS